MSAWGPAGIEAFCRTLEAACGLAYTPDKAYLFEARLPAVMARWAVPDYHALAQLFERDAEARQAITEALVTSETYFFRDEATFRALPGRLASLGPTPGAPAVVWSLGCATGQEVWSLLFALDMDGRMPLASVRVVGVDLSEAALARARAATYTAFEVGRGLEPWQASRWFQAVPDGFRVARPWRDVPEWRRLNLLEGLDPLPQPDVVLCRNVLIYFDDAVKRAVVGRIAARLRPGGLLVLGGAENAGLYADVTPPDVSVLAAVVAAGPPRPAAAAPPPA